MISVNESRPAYIDRIYINIVLCSIIVIITLILTYIVIN